MSFKLTFILFQHVFPFDWQSMNHQRRNIQFPYLFFWVSCSSQEHGVVLDKSIKKMGHHTFIASPSFSLSKHQSSNTQSKHPWISFKTQTHIPFIISIFQENPNTPMISIKHQIKKRIFLPDWWSTTGKPAKHPLIDEW